MSNIPSEGSATTKTRPVHEAGRTPAIARTLGPVRIYRDVEAVASLWREFGASALGTPYQMFDWVMAYAKTLGAANHETLIVATVEDTAGKPVLLLPLSLHRQQATTIATLPGGKQANFHMPLFDAGALHLFDRTTCLTILREIARAAGNIDVFAFSNQPAEWQGTPNPFVSLGGHLSPSPGFKRALDFPPDKTAHVLHGGETRKKMRKKERRLSEIGVLDYRQIVDPAEISRVLDVFLDQKGLRFRQKHINNPFAHPAAVAFLQRGSAPADGRKPAIELYALFVGERIIATFGGTSAGTRFCGMFNSFCTEDDVVKSSPGDLLLTHVIETQCRRGLATFDLGVGEAPYKLVVCDKIEELTDSYIPVSAKGHVYGLADGGLRTVKRWAKQTPWVLALVERARRKLA
ncbi:GNAT family N-acetyltransferase [Chelatococcus asaccharovorans]|uniref:CelD/BcsL family acetyltransferase involved in cellulose biosynthesis n=1 Tax=Chelatococcus asaccharovorans TaxID=28210 RepID=A0A2V3UES4_9HYPH|nr:GNAT family N-acetyltransferase [Chelatococcus asaccharovorans]MBS7702851.1 GNAT family N-acetyltransferase [Chelatococcus asaccharovorans]PXW57150.1 CelD/BcsL family acetyltransferase involved in cellulose biosynthesis [Chelatococcus asaccharovorans]